MCHSLWTRRAFTRRSTPQTSISARTPLFDGTWNLGNVAAVGLTLEQIVAGFTTDPDVSPGFEPIPGHFLYQVQGNNNFFAGQITAVPEPSSVVLAVSGALAGGL